MPRSMQTAQNIGGTSVKPVLGKMMTTLLPSWKPELAHILALATSELRHSAELLRNLSGLQSGLCHMNWAEFFHEHATTSASHSPGSWEGLAQRWKKHRETLCRNIEGCVGFSAPGSSWAGPAQLHLHCWAHTLHVLCVPSPLQRHTSCARCCPATCKIIPVASELRLGLHTVQLIHSPTNE